MNSLCIQTPSRLHFGLLGWGPHAERQFGGLGLMVEAPGISIHAQRATTWTFTGPHAERVQQVASLVRQQLTPPVPPLAIHVQHAPREHIGLGTGTQLSLAVARLICDLSGREHLSTLHLAALCGRGKRSGIGIHGFERGGFLVDGGTTTPDGVPPLICRLEFPAHWCVALVLPATSQGLHGNDELAAFRELPAPPPSYTDHLCRLTLRQMLPAMLEVDLRTFGRAMDELQADVGDVFAPAQGGRFASPMLARAAGSLRAHGFRGVGQSSWGPTLFGFLDQEPLSTEPLTRDLERHLGPAQVLITRASPTGAVRVTAPAPPTP